MFDFLWRLRDNPAGMGSVRHLGFDGTDHALQSAACFAENEEKKLKENGHEMAISENRMV